MKPILFISHRCTARTHQMGNFIKACLEDICIVFIDPFSLGDNIGVKLDSILKGCTHFVYLSDNQEIMSRMSRWVAIEIAFSEILSEKDCISRSLVHFGCPELLVTSGLGSFKQIIYIGVEEAKFIASIRSWIVKTPPHHFLKTNRTLSKHYNKLGRLIERHAATSETENDEVEKLHQAENAYSYSILLDLSNYHAHANLSWVLWKLGDKFRATKALRIALGLAPDSGHIRDVADRIANGQKSIR